MEVMQLVFTRMPDGSWMCHDDNTYDGPECMDVGYGKGRGQALQDLKNQRIENAWTRKTRVRWKIKTQGL